MWIFPLWRFRQWHYLNEWLHTGFYNADIDCYISFCAKTYGIRKVSFLKIAFSLVYHFYLHFFNLQFSGKQFRNGAFLWSPWWTYILFYLLLTCWWHYCNNKFNKDQKLCTYIFFIFGSKKLYLNYLSNTQNLIAPLSINWQIK